MNDNSPPLPHTFPSLNSAQRVSSESSQNSLNVPKAPVKPTSSRNKIVLKPGHSPLDWARLKQQTPVQTLTGVTQLSKYSMDDLKKHKTENDAWICLRGKVFNITPYLPFHPGGDKILLASAGRDATQLFDKYHPWVNADMLLDKCLVGFLTQ